LRAGKAGRACLVRAGGNADGRLEELAGSQPEEGHNAVPQDEQMPDGRDGGADEAVVELVPRVRWRPQTTAAHRHVSGGRLTCCLTDGEAYLGP